MKDIFDIYGISDSERLYVLGNGFDLHHNIKSGYYDFRKWLQATNQGTLIEMMDIFLAIIVHFGVILRMHWESIGRMLLPNGVNPTILTIINMSILQHGRREWKIVYHISSGM